LQIKYGVENNFFNFLKPFQMKKMMFYVIFLSLMACKKAVQPVPLPVISCDKPSNRADTAKLLIIGRWELERITILDRVNRLIIYRTKKDFPKRELNFLTNGLVELFKEDTLVASGYFKFIKDKDLYAASTVDRDFISMPVVRNGMESFVSFRICNDSLYLPYGSFAYDGAPDEVWSKKN
jgi:hypothetical protein